MDNKDYLLIIDGSGLLFTQFYGNLPAEFMYAKSDEEKERLFPKIMHTSAGVYTNAIFGFMRFLLKLVREQRPYAIAVAWDRGRDTFRKQLYPEYKATRSSVPRPLLEQFELCENVLERIGIRQFMSDEFEADDFCGTLSKKFEDSIPVRILTKDNDYLQLVSEKTNLFMMLSSSAKADELYAKYHISRTADVPDRCFLYTPEYVKKEIGVEPASVPDLKGIQGDTSDNICGVPGVGPKAAVPLVAKYRTVEALYAAMEGLDEKGLKELAESWKEIGISRSPVKKLLDEGEGLVGKKAAFLSKKLATIKRDIDLGDLKLDDLKLKMNLPELVKVFEELEFKSLKPDIGGEPEREVVPEYTSTSDIGEVSSIGEKLKTSGYFGVSFRGHKDELEGIAVTLPGKETYYIGCEGFVSGGMIEDMLNAADKAGSTAVLFDLKSAMKLCRGYRPKNAFDELIARYLISPEESEYRLMALFEGADGAAAESIEILEAYADLKKQLEELNMTALFTDIEMPLVTVLRDMEREGVLVDRKQLKEFGDKLGADIKVLENRIYELAGTTFNINSPKQLGEVLFEKLGLPSSKKTKSGYSTSAEVLEKLSADYPIVGSILEYRQLAKLKSTYADGLFDYIDPDGRIRTTFNQTVTATGRLSSTEPNLQNIPIRSELGSYIRKAFVPKPGYCFVDADYSQIELRILASMSGDEKLISAYANSEDIHRATASAVFHVSFDEVTPELRSRAKAVNFGIVYGISSFGLGQGLNIPKKEAEGYISAYFETYPDIKKFLDGLVESAKKDGCSVTLFGRRRNIPELSSALFMQRQFGERIAMNAPIQGTAADIIKIAMIRCDERLKKETPDSKLILQIHDELLVEAREEDKEKVMRILEEEMRGAADLSVSLDVGIGSGYDWTEAH